MNWHYVEQGKQIGPVTREQLTQLFQAGTINSETLVWHEGMADWLPYGQAMTVSAPDSFSQTQSTPTGAGPAIGEVICAECGKRFPAAETIRHGTVHVCATCKPVFLQKLAEGAKIETGELNYAGFGIRFAAKFLDGLFITVPVAIILVMVMIPIMGASSHNHSMESGVFPVLFQLIIQLGFFVINMAYQIFFLGKYGATPGKMICKLKVVTAQGERIGYGRACGRYFAELLSGMICYIGYLMVLFDKEKRALHDHICSTRVIYK